MSVLLDVKAVTKRFGGLTAVDAVSLQVKAGSITGLIGPNGAGKTTLFATIAGFEMPSTGDVILAGDKITHLPTHQRTLKGLVRTFQIVQPFAGLTVHENIMVGSFLRHPARADASARASEIGTRLGLGAMLNQQANALTVAGRKRLELARALATEPKLLLLDEVLAGLNPSEIRDMIPVVQQIRSSGITILIVEHVMQAVMSLCDSVYVLAQGRLIAEGAPGVVARNPEVIEAYLGHGAAARMQNQRDSSNG